MFELTFRFENDATPVTVSVSGEESVLDAARKANVAIDAPCSGNGSCGKCRVKLLKGTVDGLQTAHISDEEYAEGWRLSCCTRVTSDVTVLVPDIASAYCSRMKTADLSTGEEIAVFEQLQSNIRAAGIKAENRFTEIQLQMMPPTLDDTMPDNERLERALAEKVGRNYLTFYALHKLPEALRATNFSVRIVGVPTECGFAVYDITAPDDAAPLCGLAIDIGTTTVSAVLFELHSGRLLAKASGGNGQIRYGADVINRIVEQSKPGGRKKLQDAIVKETLLPLIAALCADAHVKATRIVRLCVASNTTMNHLLLALDANSVRTEPYIPAFFHLKGVAASDLGLPVHPQAELRIAPNIGSYVGGDITAGTFASMLWNAEELSLFIDLGTNGEIVFGNRDFLVSCACSAGPAFEGGDISCGMRATDGAIESVQLDAVSMEPIYSVIGKAGQKPVGLCGSGIIDMIAELFRCGFINSKGIFVREGARIAHDRHGTGRYIIATPQESETGREISLNEVDILNFIRAKGAIYSAIDTLLSAMDMTENVISTFYVAGGIGSGINMKNAVRIGMFPNVPLERFRYIGNSSLAGAYAMALSDEANEKVAEMASNMTYMELSTHTGYMDAFVAACFLPHTDASRFTGLD